MSASALAGISDFIRVNSIGFHPDYAKGATVVGALGSKFEIVQVGNDAEAVFEGRLSSERINADTGERVRLADFSALSRVGEYRLKIKGLGSSAAFSINQRVFRDSLNLQLLGFYGQRCGQAVRFKYAMEIYSHPICHGYDAYTDFIGDKGTKDGVGGWHDAGDYNKYTLNSAAAVGMLLSAWDHFPLVLKDAKPAYLKSDEKLPYFLDEIKWELLWMLKMQWEDGRVSHKLSAKRFNSFELPHKEKKPRYFSDWGSASTAAFAGAMAMAARAFETADPALSARCKGAAKDAWAALQKYPQGHEPDQSNFKTGSYTSADGEHLIFAAGELYRLTQEPVYHQAFKRLLEEQKKKVAANWDWQTLANLGLWAYISMDKKDTDPALRKAIEKQTLAAADELAVNSLEHGYGRALTKYNWGSNGNVARTAILLEYAWRLSGSKKYLDVMQNQASYLYGRNYYNRSQVTGEGYHPPMHPHHRPSGGDAIEDPWPGLLVGGGWPDGKSWRDTQSSARFNENAINWSAAMVYLLAGLNSVHK